MKAVLTPSLIVLLVILASGSQAWARQIHYFKVYCDAYPVGRGDQINASVSMDRMTVNNLFAQNVNEQSWGITQRDVEIFGASATAQTVVSKWQEFSKGIAAEDTVFVYFSGHGSIADRVKNDVLLLTCDSKQISRTEWATSIDALPCKLKIFITDCCSSFTPHEVAEGDEVVTPWTTLYYLLLKHEGFVNITAASPGQEAWASQIGSFLTVNLVSDMQRHKSWAKVFSDASARVFEEVARDVGSKQMPFAFGLGRALFDTGTGTSAGGDQANDYVLADSNRRMLARSELDRLGLQQLYFARNEIFARHGFDFSTPLLKFYFSTRGWYSLQPGLKSPPLSQIEQYNVNLIREVEVSKGGPFAAGTNQLPGEGQGAVPDIFPYSSTQSITRSAVEKLSQKELSIARNEIYARHGYPFSSPALQQFFSRKASYRRNPSMTSPPFNAYEKQNIWLINKLERIKGGPYKW